MGEGHGPYLLVVVVGVGVAPELHDLAKTLRIGLGEVVALGLGIVLGLLTGNLHGELRALLGRVTGVAAVGAVAVAGGLGIGLGLDLHPDGLRLANNLPPITHLSGGEDLGVDGGLLGRLGLGLGRGLPGELPARADAVILLVAVAAADGLGLGLLGLLGQGHGSGPPGVGGVAPDEVRGDGGSGDLQVMLVALGGARERGE